MKFVALREKNKGQLKYTSIYNKNRKSIDIREIGSFHAKKDSFRLSISKFYSSIL